MSQILRIAKTNKKTPDSGPNEFGLQKFIVRAMVSWPPDLEKSSVLRTIGVLYQVPCAISFVGVCINLWTDPKPGGPVQFLQNFADGIGFFTLCTKGYSIYKGQHQIMALKAIIEQFHERETVLGLHVIRKKRPIWPWIPCYIFLLQTFASLSVLYVSLTAQRKEDRISSVPTPKFIFGNDLFFYPWMAVFIFSHILNYVTYGSLAVDGLYICFTGVIQDKAETLNRAMNSLEKVKNDNDLNTTLRSLVEYHQLIIEMRNGTEKLCGAPALLLVLHIMISLATLIIRLVFVGLPANQASFALAYLTWIICQLVTYCMLGESATAAASKISGMAYEAYQPYMAPELVKKLTFIVQRSQKPLKLTALGLITLNRRTLLEVLKRCYSTFSALSRMKGI